MPFADPQISQTTNRNRVYTYRMTYTITTSRDMDLLQLLDAVAELVEPGQPHPPSTDTLAMRVDGDRFTGVRHYRLGIEIAVS